MPNHTYITVSLVFERSPNKMPENRNLSQSQESKKMVSSRIHFLNRSMSAHYFYFPFVFFFRSNNRKHKVNRDKSPANPSLHN